MPPSSSPFRVPPDQSKTAALLHAYDWADSPLGPPEQWPESLHIALGICLNSRFPMFVWWGERLINLYNDAYIPILGARHPAAFGQPASEVWHEIWDIVGRQANAVMTHGEATWNERVLLMLERHGYVEETWFTWSYSPIPDGRGGVAGLFCACKEDTAAVIAERERAELVDALAYERTRLADAFAQSPAFVAVVRGPDHVFEFANQRYRELVGQRELIGLPVYQAMPEVELQGFIKLLDRVYTTGEPFVGRDTPIQLRRDIAGPLETRYVDFSYQAMRSADGAIIGVLAHGMDVTERRHAEARDRLLVGIDDAVRAMLDPHSIITTCARLLNDYLGTDRCLYAHVLPDENRFDSLGGHAGALPLALGRYSLDVFGEDARARLRQGQPLVVNDSTNESEPALSVWRALETRAAVCAPVIKAGRLSALMAVHQATPRTWDATEIELVVRVANRCWESIERARVQRALAWSEQRFRTAATAMSDIVWTCDPQGRFEDAQPAWQAYTGQRPEEYLGYGWQQAVHPEDTAGTMEAWYAAAGREGVFEHRHRLRRADGVYRTCAVRAVPLIGADGEPREWVGVHTDIQERVEFEQSLQESEARFRSLADNAPVMIWMARANGQCEYINRQWLDFTGQDPESALGLGWLDAVHPDDVARTGRVFLDANARQAPFSDEYWLRRHDGVYRWCVDTASPRFGANGEYLGYIGTVVDITERKRMEDVLASEKRVLELVATGSPVPEVLDTLVRRMEAQSVDGMLCSVLLVSDDGRRLLHGAAPSLPEAYSGAVSGIEIGEGRGSCGTAAHRHGVVSVGDIGTDPLWAEWRDLAREHGLAACTSTPIFSSQGRLLGTLALYYRSAREPSERDLELSVVGAHLASIVLEKHGLDERLRFSLEAEQEARGVAERASRMKDEFLATLSHELRTPLNAILGWVAILRLRKDLPAEFAQAVDVIERNARAQSQIIGDLLDMSSIVSGKVRLERTRVPVVELVENALESARPAAEARQVHLEAAVEADARLEVDVDAHRLQQVLWNLLSNALKFTSRGGRVELRARRVSGRLELVVSDTGEGIDAAFLPFVFDRFRQADASMSRRHGGLGLGLAIVRRLVELHGGDVRAHSAGAGQGAQFTVGLPLVVADALPPMAEVEVFDAIGQLAGRRVLVVDDDPDARLMTARLLESAGAQTAMAASAADASNVLAAEPFDVLVSDIGMPEQDGYAFLEQLRADAAHPGHDIPAVALTAYARAQERARALQAGFQKHLAKPVDPVALINTVASLATPPPSQTRH
ncbi:PAS domain S-box protein [Cognatilysobacter bugurensis]|uniref:histidine kinase n=1 Tax=Cognatilysobacter bugurensis TaxID=543356 RepID=A0A918W709_9GAMM|nr:PAS domain S-box protein [Lysobacter bugurensis]GHA80007.1 histidine kinase [Lysobacter bugurensis]